MASAMDMTLEQARFEGFSITDRKDQVRASAAEQRTHRELERLGLLGNARDLDHDGFTIIRPEQLAPQPFIEELRSILVTLIGDEHNVDIDLATGFHQRPGAVENVNIHGAGILSKTALLGENPIFEKVLMNEAVLALVTYLLGESCDMSDMSSFAKAQGGSYLEMHVDHMGMPEPLPAFPFTANATWVLTDYTIDAGPTCFRRGSHKLLRRPTASEAKDIALFEPVDVPAGSVLLWGGNTWHSSMPRTAPGVRLTLLVYYARWFYYKHQKDITERVTPEMLARNPRRFRRLVGLDYPELLDPADEAVPTMGRTCLNPYA